MTSSTRECGGEIQAQVPGGYSLPHDHHGRRIYTNPLLGLPFNLQAVVT